MEVFKNSILVSSLIQDHPSLFLVDGEDGPEHAAGGDDFVAFFQLSEELLVLLLASSAGGGSGGDTSPQTSARARSIIATVTAFAPPPRPLSTNHS